MEDDYYTVDEASRILGLTGPRIRQLLYEKGLKGEQDPLSGRWRVDQRSLHEMKERRDAKKLSREPSKVTPAETLDWLERVEALRQELGRMEGRLELTTQAESTLREQLEREQGRADKERERADRLEERAEQLRDELEAERSKGFWARLFGR